MVTLDREVTVVLWRVWVLCVYVVLFLLLLDGGLLGMV
jgi:hypothetical protein